MSVLTQMPPVSLQTPRQCHYGARPQPACLTQSQRMHPQMQPEPLRMNLSSGTTPGRVFPSQGSMPSRGAYSNHNVPHVLAQGLVDRAPSTTLAEGPRVRSAGSVAQAFPADKSPTKARSVVLPHCAIKPTDAQPRASALGRPVLLGAQHATTPQSCRKLEHSHSPASTASSETVRFRCPTCSEYAGSMEQAVAHCLGSSPSRASYGSSPTRETCAEGTFKCPSCGAFAASIEEALSCCGLDKPSQEAGIARDVPKSDDDSLLYGEAIAYDKDGRPTIVREVDAKTGLPSTIVVEEDGSRQAFGDVTVTFLTSSSDEQINEWLAALSCQQLRGLSHEVGQRLVEGSKFYHEGLAELEELHDQLNYLYFGLTSDSTEKDLDNAYRRLARKMHPDKNGGTEEAKRKFQHMKERYEALKKKFSESGADDASEEAENDRIESIKDATRYTPYAQASGVASHQNQAAAPFHKKEESVQTLDVEGELDETAVVSSSYDPKDKDSMMEYVSKVARQLHEISEQKSEVIKQLGQARIVLNDTSPCQEDR